MGGQDRSAARAGQRSPGRRLNDRQGLALPLGAAESQELGDDGVLNSGAERPQANVQRTLPTRTEESPRCWV
jgi:hypothetical protein